jgi:hypothetical protein
VWIGLGDLRTYYKEVVRICHTPAFKGNPMKTGYLLSYFTRDIPGFQKTIADKYSSIDALKKLSASLEGIKSPKDEILHKLIEYIRGAHRDEKILVYSHSVVYLERLEREMKFKPEFKHVLVKGE